MSATTTRTASAATPIIQRGTFQPWLGTTDVGRGAREGVLIKNAETIERIEKVDTLVIDKTGTLTEGRPRVTDIVPIEPSGEYELLRLAASIERNSEHPLGRAVVEAARDRGIELASVEHLFDARFILSGHLARNLPIDMGRSTILRCENVHLVVTSRSGPHFAPQLFQAGGLDPFAAQVLVAKSLCGFRAAYAKVAREIMVVAAPGCAPADFWKYDYAQIPRPLWPWDDLQDWHAAPSVVPSPVLAAQQP